MEKIKKEIRLRITEAKKWYSKQTPQQKVVLIATFSILTILALYLSGYVTMFGLAMSGVYSLRHATSLGFIRYMIIGVFTVKGITTTLVIGLIFYGTALLIIVSKSKELDIVDETDDRGVNFAKDGTYGTSRPMTKAEAKETYAVGNIDELDGYILGQLSEGGKECITLPTSSTGNQNYLVIGGPGRGKSFSFVINAALQAMKRGESVVLTDPKGELAEALYNVFAQAGYITKVYNLVNPKRSDAWNFTNEIFSIHTGELDIDRLTSFAEIIMTNTLDGEKEDGFWGPGERNLFKAGIAYTSWNFESLYKNNLKKSAMGMEEVGMSLISNEDKDKLFKIINDKKSTILEKETALRTLLAATGEITDEDINTYIDEIRAASEPVTIDRIFGMFVKYDIIMLANLFTTAQIPASHPASIAWSIFMRGDAKVQPGFVTGLAQRLQLFSNNAITTMSAHNDINFREISEKKTALFCIVSDKDSSKRLLSSLFFSFLFRDISDAADELGAATRLPVNILCDEFAAIGRIPDFERFIAVVRSRKIYMSIIIQSISQLALNYDENRQEILIECCDTVLFLGCNGTKTAEFISELSGGATIITDSIRDSKSVIGLRGMAQGYMTSAGAGQRYLFDAAEVRRLKQEEVLIYHVGCQMLKANRCGYIEQGIYKKGFPAKYPMSRYPLTTDKYGEYQSIFDDITVATLTEQKTWNIVNAKLLKNIGIQAFDKEKMDTYMEIKKERSQQPKNEFSQQSLQQTDGIHQETPPLPINKGSKGKKKPVRKPQITNPYLAPQQGDEGNHNKTSSGAKNSNMFTNSFDQ